MQIPLVLAAIGGVRGGEPSINSVLGLPSPRVAGRPGAVLLHGGGRITDEVFARFVARAGGERARIVFVPSAGYRLANYDGRRQYIDAMTRRYGSWADLAASGRIASFEFLTTDDPDDADDADDAAFVKPLESATGVWFSGGAQSRLNYRYVGVFPRRTRFQAALREVLERGGVVGGTSAGMAALPEIMTLYQDRDRADGPLSVIPGHGLGLFDGAIVEQHFDGQGGRLERFTGLLRDSDKLDRLAARRGAGSRMVGLAVEGSAGLVLQADRLESLGPGNTHVFLKSADGRAITWHLLKPGDRGTLKRDLRGNTTLIAGPSKGSLRRD